MQFFTWNFIKTLYLFKEGIIKNYTLSHLNTSIIYLIAYDFNIYLKLFLI